MVDFTLSKIDVVYFCNRILISNTFITTQPSRLKLMVDFVLTKNNRTKTCIVFQILLSPPNQAD